MSRPPSSGSDTSRFLKLPAELRLMIYEHIPNEVFRYEFREDGATRKSGLSLQIVQVGTAILSTCRQIHMEVIEIIKRKQALAASIPISIAITRWGEGSVVLFYSLHYKISNARRNLIAPRGIYPHLSLPGSILLQSAYNRLIRALPDIEFVIDFPNMGLYYNARAVLTEVACYRGCFEFQPTVRIPPGSISKKNFDFFQSLEGIIVIWDEYKD